MSSTKKSGRRRKQRQNPQVGAGSHCTAKSTSVGDNLDEGTLLAILPKDTKQIISISPERQFQSLWAGYGSIGSFTVRRLVHDDVEQNVEHDLNLIIEKVHPPPTKGDGGISHRRKMRSYEVECNFYQHVTPLMEEQSVSVSEGVSCAIPHAYHVQVTPPTTITNNTSHPTSFTLILSDLRDMYPIAEPPLDLQRTKAALNWLSSFHVTYWEMGEVLQGGIPPISIWECGGYWHLDTRQDELNDISDTSEWARLKVCAHGIDKRIKNKHNDGDIDADGTSSFSFQTLCHGDFKSANLLYKRNGSECAAVDFQYVGGGYGMKDVVMLLVSSTECDLSTNDGTTERSLLEYYYNSLVDKLRIIGRVTHDRIKAYTFDIAMMHYELCLIDYVRFMAGWGFWGNNCYYAQDRVNEILDELEGSSSRTRKRRKMTVSDWEYAIYRRYPLQ